MMQEPEGNEPPFGSAIGTSCPLSEIQVESASVPLPLPPVQQERHTVPHQQQLVHPAQTSFVNCQHTYHLAQAAKLEHTSLGKPALCMQPTGHVHFICGNNDPDAPDQQSRLLTGYIDLQNYDIQYNSHMIYWPLRNVQFADPCTLVSAMGDYILRWTLPRDRLGNPNYAWCPKKHTEPIVDMCPHPNIRQQPFVISGGFDSRVALFDIARMPNPKGIPNLEVSGYELPHVPGYNVGPTVTSLAWAHAHSDFIADSAWIYSVTSDEDGFFRMVDSRDPRSAVLQHPGIKEKGLYTHAQLGASSIYVLGYEDGTLAQFDARVTSTSVGNKQVPLLQSLKNPTGTIGDIEVHRPSGTLACTGEGLSMWAREPDGTLVLRWMNQENTRTEGRFLDSGHFFMSTGDGRLSIYMLTSHQPPQVTTPIPFPH
eukprot:gnl/Trimastix_PCT/3284.p1 GENE.gnl/Trimastix_PCT/3284~~gnl/Trimastix_PCT/3284.p1  ORF type:complete len:426 (-),score=23.04 gnl/Trimastix_PCT/3284:213-1490(-)